MRATLSRLSCLALLGLSVVAGCGEQPSSARSGNAADAVAESPLPVSGAATPVAVAAAADGTARCPVSIGAGFATPAGGRVMGPLPATATPLSYATVIDSTPADVRDDRALSEDEADDTAEDGTGVYALRPTADAPHSLACGYGMKPGFTEQGTLVVIPLPTDTAQECRVRVGPPGATQAGCTAT